MSTVTSSHRDSSAVHYSANDTISLGQGTDTVFQQGQATVQGLFGQHTLGGSALQVIHASFEGTAGKATLMGGSFSADFGTANKFQMHSGLSSTDTLAGAMHDTLASSSFSKGLFEFLSADSGQHVLTEFVSGKSQLHIEGNSFAQLQQTHEISSVGGTTTIRFDGGATSIELKGLSKIDITHKPS